MANERIVINQDDSVTVRLRNVRLSFPALFKPRAFDETKEPSFSAVFLMAKEGDPEKNAVYVNQGIQAVIKAAFKGKHPGRERVCLKDAAEKGERGVDGYDDTLYFVSTGNKKKVPIVDRDLTPLVETDGKPYAGCFVNATIRLWAQDHKQYGKRVNAQLKAIQFFGDGEPFGEPSVDPAEEFEAVGEDEAL